MFKDDLKSKHSGAARCGGVLAVSLLAAPLLAHANSPAQALLNSRFGTNQSVLQFTSTDSWWSSPPSWLSEVPAAGASWGNIAPRARIQSSPERSGKKPTIFRAEAGAIMARGNSHTDAFNAKFDVSWNRNSWKQSLGASAVYASDATGTTGQRWDVRSQTDYQFHQRGFSFASARYEQDRFSGFEYQAAYSSGLGWRFYDQPDTRLSAQIGLGYRQLRARPELAEDGITLLQSARDEDLVEQAKAEFERALNDNTRLLNQFLAETGSDNTFMRNDFSVQVKIVSSLALAVGYSVRYNTKPPEGFATTDTLSTLNLVYELR